MKKITLLIIVVLTSVTFLSAQFKERLVAGESNNLPVDQRIDLQKIKPFSAKEKIEGIQLNNFSTLNFEISSNSQFAVKRKNSNNAVEWMTGIVNSDKSASWKVKAEQWLNEASEILQTDHKTNQFKVASINTDALQQTHIRMHQFHKGVRVYNAEIILHGRDGRLNLQNGSYFPSAMLPNEVTSQLNEEDVKAVIIKQLKHYHEDFNKKNTLGIPVNFNRWNVEQVIYRHKDEFVIAFHATVYPNLGEHFEYFVNAKTGEIINYFSTICSAHNHDHGHPVDNNPPDGPAIGNADDLSGMTQTIHTYELSNNFFLIDASRDMFSSQSSMLPDDPVGVIWTIDLNHTSPINTNAQYSHVVSGDNTWAESPEGVSAHYNAGKAYDYFKSTFNRESITGTGQNIISFVNVADEDGSSLGNAFWNGLGIYYGNGDGAFFSLGRALDVAGHEISHGVIQSTANLEYFGESGALNESFADVFGSMIDRDDWQIGEDVVKTSAFPSGALRNLEDPHNGAATGDFGRGWQPKHVNEQYTGTEDNGGVHINSGIPNHAFYLIANQIGKTKAEQIYFRALTTYLTRSSGFNEMRFAALKATEDLYGNAELEAVGDAFDQVGISVGSEGGFEENIDVNPGADLLMVSDQNKSNILIFDLDSGYPIFDPLINIDQLSKPSITDDGSRVVFVGIDQHIYITDIDWTASPPTSNTFVASYYPEWRNAVISKDGNRVALLDESLKNEIIILDLPSNSQNVFRLTNPTSSNGVSTGDVLYADAMEFDVSGNVLMYDAINEIQGANSGKLEFWDIAFVEIWNPAADTWALGRIDKLFGALPEGLSVGNPAFSKNSPHIIAMDFIDGLEVSILGVNIETGDIGELFTNTTLGYPNYSRGDDFLIYDLDFLGNVDVGISQLNSDKITAIINSENILGPNLRWGLWFSNGTRILTNNEEIITDESILSLSPNPASDYLEIQLSGDDFSKKINLEIYEISGRLMRTIPMDKSALQTYRVDVSDLPQGNYILSVRDDKKIVSKKFVVE